MGSAHLEEDGLALPEGRKREIEGGVGVAGTMMMNNAMAKGAKRPNVMSCWHPTEEITMGTDSDTQGIVKLNDGMGILRMRFASPFGLFSVTRFFFNLVKAATEMVKGK